MRCLGLLFVVLAMPSSALAHKLELVAKFPADRPLNIRVEVGFEGDEPAEGARVRLLDSVGTVVAEGLSDAKGVCELLRPPPGSYTLVANDGDGHQAKLALVVPDGSTTVEIGHRSTILERVVSAVVGLGLIGVAAAALILYMRRRTQTPPREA